MSYSSKYKNYNQNIIKNEKLDYLYSFLRNSIIANLFVAVIITIFLWKKTNLKSILFWSITIFILFIIRYITIAIYKNNTNKNNSTFYTIFLIFMFLTALIWGFSGFILFTPDNQTNLLLLVTILGIAIGAITTLSIDRLAFNLYQSTLLLPIITSLLLYKSDYYTTLALLFFIFYILILVMGKRIYKIFFKNIIFKQRHKKNMDKLLVSEKKFKSIFDHAPVGIFYYNSDLIIYECNQEFSSILDTKKTYLINLDLNTLKDRRIIDAIKAPLNSKLGFYEGEYLTTISKTKIWVNMKCSALFDEDKKIIGAIGIIQDRTEFQLIEEKVRHIAYHDSLTGLPNRLLLKDRMNQAINLSKRSKHYGALLFLDLDNFKKINDTLGHHVGDTILIETADRLKGVLRVEDTVSRIGGDEFVIILPKLHTTIDASLASVNLVTKKIHDVLKQPFLHVENTLYTSTSIGIVFFSDDKQNFDELLKNADTAMYEAKNDGKGCSHFYNKGMNSVAQKRLTLEQNLRIAVKNNELVPYFQPIYDASKKTLIGAETLLRWIHPTLGIVSPLDFIPISEETNLIIPISEWLIEEIFKKMQVWEKYIEYISINISVKQIRKNNFIEILIDTAKKYNINPKQIVLEITENILIGNFDSISSKIRRLREEGFCFALDDFGTGYSSLTYLKKLELDILKIDREFIKDINNDNNDAALVETILSLAHNFKMKVIAEGVEAPEQILKLTSMGCKFFQGFYFSKPLPMDVFEKLVLNCRRS